MMNERVSFNGKTAASNPANVGSIPTTRAMNVKWAAVVAAILLLGGLLCGGFAFWLGNWDTFAFAALMVGAGVGFAILNLNDKE